MSVPQSALHANAALVVRHLGLRDYLPIWRAMQAYTAARNADSVDQLWLLEHTPVYTLGYNGKHPAPDGGIPFLHCDRGGDVTYHGPGQLIAYVLIDLRRRGLAVKTLVQRLEQAVIDLLADLDITAARRPGAPGVYIAGQKIAALGLRVRNGCSYHGVALNVDMDLGPFSRIAPCGYRDLQVTQLADFNCGRDRDAISAGLEAQLCRHLGYNRVLQPEPVDDTSL